MATLSIIIPTLDEAAIIDAALRALAPLRERGAEVIVADGGSRDETAALAELLADAVVTAPRGRAAQMNAGAAASHGEVLLFLHADTRLPPDADFLILAAMDGTTWQWGRFDVSIDGRSRLLPIVAGMMNWRSLATGIATGDQAMFVTRQAFEAVGGFPDIPLMEDIAISKRLKQISRPFCVTARVATSGRRWETRGVLRTVLLMWRLRLSFYFGTPPEKLARQYGYAPRDG